MPVAEASDPRLQALFGATNPRDVGVKPVVRLPHKGVPTWVVVAGAAFAGLLLFLFLDARRTEQVPPVEPEVAATAWQAPPPLYVPAMPAPVATPVVPAEPAPRPAVVVAPMIRPATPSVPQVAYVPPIMPQAAPPPIPLQSPRRAVGGAPLVIDTRGATDPTAGDAAGASGLRGGSALLGSRVRASSFANRSTTVPQGTLIQAVLETGFNSSQPGFARALVSRDVRSFDGRNILLPRGSRLIGQYRSDVGQGQARAVIAWTRLIRPDGMTIALDSPAVDTLGRGGVPASVNTHFFQRLGDALLQSTVGFGAAFAQRAASGPMIVVPGANGQGAGVAATAQSYAPTLTVPAGKSISVFVAHDLDFSSAGAAQ